jgi:hypothetical protein
LENGENGENVKNRENGLKDDEGRAMGMNSEEIPSK